MLIVQTMNSSSITMNSKKSPIVKILLSVVVLMVKPLNKSKVEKIVQLMYQEIQVVQLLNLVPVQILLFVNSMKKVLTVLLMYNLMLTLIPVPLLNLVVVQMELPTCMIKMDLTVLLMKKKFLKNVP